MTTRTPMPQMLAMSDTQQQLHDLVRQVVRQEIRVILEEGGAPVAAIISAEDLRRLQEFDEQRVRDFALMEEFAAAFADVPADEIEREVSAAVAEVRAEQRQRAEAAHVAQ